MNALLEIGYAFVTDINDAEDDWVIGVQFVGGGDLHIKLSCLNRAGLRAVQFYSNGYYLESAA